MLMLLNLKMVSLRYNEHYKSMNDSSPRNISEDFPGINGPINAAVYKHGMYYFILAYLSFVCICMYFQSHNNVSYQIYCLFQGSSISLSAQMCINITSNKKKLLELIKQCPGLGVNRQLFK